MAPFLWRAVSVNWWACLNHLHLGAQLNGIAFHNSTCLESWVVTCTVHWSVNSPLLWSSTKSPSPFWPLVVIAKPSSNIATVALLVHALNSAHTHLLTTAWVMRLRIFHRSVISHLWKFHGLPLTDCLKVFGNVYSLNSKLLRKFGVLANFGISSINLHVRCMFKF